MITGRRKPRGKDLTAAQRAAKRLQAQLRCVGERGNARLKHWKVLASELRCRPGQCRPPRRAVRHDRYQAATPEPPALPYPSPALHPANDPFVARYAAGHDGSAAGRIDLASVPEQHWQIGTGSGQLAFRTLTAEEAGAVRDSLRHLPRLGEAPLAGGAVPLPADWGDVFAVIAYGAASVVDIVVSAVSNAVEASITLLIQGVKYLFEAGIEFIEQVLDLAQEVFTLLKAPFERLAGYLGWVPNWPDILRTYRALAYLPSQVPVLAEAAVTKARDTVVGVIGNWQARLKKAVEDYVTTVLPPGTTIGSALEAESGQSHALNLLSDQRNVYLTALRDNIATASVSSAQMGDVLPPDLLSAIDTLLTRLQYYGSQFESSEAFGRAVAYFSQIDDDPSKFLNLTLAGLVELAGALAQLALDVGKTVIGLIFDAVLLVIKAISVIFTDPWDIWLLSDLYAWLTDGDTLNALNVYALVLAIPVTLTYKAMFHDQVPFPTDASLAAFEASYSGAQLVRLCGLGTRTAAAASDAPAPVPDAAPATGHAGLMGDPPRMWAPIVLGLNYIFYGLTEAIVDVQPPLPKGGGPVTPAVKARVGYRAVGPTAFTAWSVAGLIAEFGIVIWGNPWFISTDPDNWDPYNDASLGNFFWAIKILEPLADAASMAKLQKLVRNIDGVGASVITGWGLFDCATMIWNAVVQGDKVWTRSVGDVLSTVPEMLKVLRTPTVVYKTPFPGLSLLALALIDALVDVLTGAFYIASTGIGPRLEED